MSFDLDTLKQTVADHGAVARVVIADIKGSTPREVGAAMLVWADGQSGTIGGGTLEFQATTAARKMLTLNQDQITKHPLGPALGQCCGGSVTLLTEIYDAARANSIGDTPVVRGNGDMPLDVQRILAYERNSTQPVTPQMINGWMIEPIMQPSHDIWIWGAGHVGRALVHTLAPLPDLNITWADTDSDRFPDEPVKSVTKVPTADMPTLVKHAPTHAEHFILTYSHAIDLELCHQLLLHSFRFAGLIGSLTKWARFKSRLRDLGHADTSIARITCPIGDPALGKHPQAIAVSVAAALLNSNKNAALKERTG
ncbi:xanthine dehydrogenase accessory protein XdhC [Parasulfitobacter algicola]|uniref:Xanthine dehydrogenase accessory protein XdhC n=1 Tax=Parasulfitobacter algicola TaxID=2614809 RepID=A0ABX2IQG0_9RHOB|nr:xanthine dehydrogenase accessory protein XdhC [Sulfitobacter algicola]NSX55098.1 xanthine dehydrogenase accessory protein XdhC [Sulfitobacter algicola]